MYAKDNTKIFSKQRVECYLEDGYFGSLPTYTQEQSEMLRDLWLKSMERRGWVYDKIISTYEISLADEINLEPEYEFASQESLIEALSNYSLITKIEQELKGQKL